MLVECGGESLRALCWTIAMSRLQTRSAVPNQVEEHLARGDRPAAIRCLEQALREHPRNFQAWMLFARLLHEDGQYEASVRAVQTCEQVDPLVGEFRSIQNHLQRGDLQKAELTARGMLAACPGHPRAIFTLAHIEQVRGRHERRVAILEEGLEHAPANPVLLRTLVGACESSGAYRQAVDTARRLVDLQETFETVWGLTSILLRYGQNESALEMCGRAEALARDDSARLSDVALVRGQVLRILGHRDHSITSLQESLSFNPRNAASWWALADTKTYRLSDAEGAAIQRLEMNPDLEPHQRAMAAFAWARQREISGDIDRAMQAYHRANALCASASFDIETVESAVERLGNSFGKDRLSGQATLRQGAPIPIFVTGLPRSGSTLIEQILASHSRIEGTMELPVLPSIKRRAHLLCQERFDGDYPGALDNFSASELAQLGEAYLSEAEFFRNSDTPFFIDKLPFNFEHVGLIHKILPQAVIINACRNPLDCGLSLYKQYFSQGSAFSYDLGNIGAYYKLHLSIIDHWQSRLPGKVLDIQYERLVRSPEDQVRRLLDHVGVEFETGCLEFWNTARAVRTASSEQVRQPLYGDAIGAWKRFDHHLGRLREGLGEDTIARFADFLE